MELPLVQVDAFADRPFTGNPAAVMRLPRWLDDDVLAAIAAENNLSETAFVVEEPGGLRLRWFTPTVEVALCGHATLAAGYVLLGDAGPEVDAVVFATRSGPLTVRRSAEDRDRLELELPCVPSVPTDDVPPALIDAVRAGGGAAPVEVHRVKSVHAATYWMAVFADPADIVALAPDTRRLGRELRSNVICAAPGAPAGAADGVDFVSRFFAPASGVDEDPVTGSAHATLAPYFAARLAKNPLEARQLSKRGGAVRCRVDGDRVWLGGRCAPYLVGVVQVPG